MISHVPNVIALIQYYLLIRCVPNHVFCR